MYSGKVANKKKCEVYATRKPYRGHRHRAAASALSLAAPCAQQRPLHPRRVYRHERDGGDYRFSRYSESGEAANRTEIVFPTNEQYENRSKLLRYHYKQEPMRMQRSGESSEAEYKRPMLPPATYPARELRRIVCWLLILSAEI